MANENLLYHTGTVLSAPCDLGGKGVPKERIYVHTQASPVAQTGKNPPAVQETWVRSSGWEDPLEEGLATHSGSLAWRMPVVKGTCGLQSTGLQRVRHD